MKVAITTLGCKANQYDSFAIKGMLTENCMVVPFPEPADAYIINTCTVTSIADYKSRYLIRKAVTANPNAVIIVTGCYSQVYPDEVKNIDGIDYILGNAEKSEILNLICKGKQEYPQVILNTLQPEMESLRLNLSARGSSERTRAFLKIQDGCSRFCSYCIIPYARGSARSLASDDVIRKIELLLQNDYREIVLTGIHLGSYGGQDKYNSITKLIKEIDRRNYPCRFRISSLDPDEAADELIELISRAGSICNHLHLAVQSLDDEILKRMNRRHYSQKLFIEKVEKIYKTIANVSIGADIIAGFPGETNAQFMNTYKILEGLPLAYFHVFPFSARKGTSAYDFQDTIDSRIKKERCLMLKRLSEVKRHDFYRMHIGKAVSVLVESADGNLAGGKSKNYIPVTFQDKTRMINKEVSVLLKEVRGREVFGVYDRCL